MELKHVDFDGCSDSRFFAGQPVGALGLGGRVHVQRVGRFGLIYVHRDLLSFNHITR